VHGTEAIWLSETLLGTLEYETITIDGFEATTTIEESLNEVTNEAATATGLDQLDGTKTVYGNEATADCGTEATALDGTQSGTLDH